MVANVQDARAHTVNKDETIPSENEMKMLFEASMKKQQLDGKPKVTREEQTTFFSAMKDPAFRSLLNDYMHEISDPNNREETERYLSQLESEEKIPQDKILVKPLPGFVVKTKWEVTEKIFINVCSSDKMEPPSSTKVTVGQQGTSWQLPYSVGPERFEEDQGGRKVSTFDVCFHPRVLEFTKTQRNYRDMVVKTCLDGVEAILQDTRRKKNGGLERKYVVLKGVCYKSGNPVTMCLKNELKDSNQKKDEMKQVKHCKDDEKTKREDGNDNEMNLQEKSLIRNENSCTSSDKTTVAKGKKIEYQMIYRGRFELFHHMQADVDKKVPTDRHRPKELVIELSFPLATSAKGLDLDVSDQKLRLLPGPDVPGDYEPLEVTLPYPVIESKGDAKFNRKTHKLIVTLPVQPPMKPEPQPISLIVQDDKNEEDEDESTELAVVEKPTVHVFKQKKSDDEFSMLREVALMVEHDPQVLAFKQRALDAESVTFSVLNEETISHSDNDCDSKAATFDVETTSITAEVEATKTLTPPFEIQETPSCFSYIVNVAGIESMSVQLTFPSTTSLRLYFSDNTKHVYELFIPMLSVDIDPFRAEVDVASENMVIILYKKSPILQAETTHSAVQPDASTSSLAPLLASARFKNQLVYELD
ncbi:putative PIH1D1/2/3, CS-like domain-containing protein [Plasmopara halstedii]